MKTTILLTVLALAARGASTIPPACLLHAVNTQDDPSNLSSICGNGANDVQSFLAMNCGNYADTAQKAFIATCSSAGTSVAPYTATKTSGSSASGTRASGSGSASASSTSTGAANVDNKAPLGSVAAAAIALIGAVAAL